MKGKVALVTGAGRGYGKGIALALGRAGACVAVNDIVGETARQTASEILATGGSAFPVQADVAAPEQVNSMFDAVLGQAGRIDILVNNAAILIWSRIPTLSLEDWQRVLAVNLTGPLLCSQAAARAMIRQEEGGRIIMIGSVVGSKITRDENAPYNVSKAALVALAKSLALELAPYRITVNLVSPGSSGGPMATAHFSEKVEHGEAIERLVKGDARRWRLGVPLGKLAQPEDAANAVLFFASDAAHHITGTDLYVDGGQGMF